MDKTAELMFEYLRDLIYEPANAKLELDALPEDFRQLGEGLLFLGHNVDELRTFAQALAKGNLSVSPPSAGNELAAPLKSLHASLRHLTWQSQQVAKGDYGQRVDFMGDFAEAFNTMTEQLEERQKALIAEIESGRRKTMALEQSNSLFEAMTANLPQWIIVVDTKSADLLYSNRIAQEMLSREDSFSMALCEWLVRDSGGDDVQGVVGERSLCLPLNGKDCYLAVTSSPLNWRQRSAVAYVLEDVTEEKARVLELEKHAYHDVLTGVSNRYAGMQVLREWVEQKRTFCLCFADLDNLKYVNDTFGHVEGDRYIITVARCMQGFSADALVSRLGGDEFMVLAQGVTQAQGEARMEELRDMLVNSSGTEEGREYLRSISYGVVGVDGSNQMKPSDLLSLADERMYMFKRRHRCSRRTAPAE